MNIERVARILLGVAALCLLLVNAGCNGTLSSALDSGSTSLPSTNVKAPGDWGRPLLAGGVVGVGMFPAKFTFDVNAAPDCTNDFVAFNTSFAGISATAAATRMGTFTSGPTNGQTVTIGNPTFGTSIVLTASGALNTGLNFQNSATVAIVAANLAAAIVRNGAGVGVTATSAAGVVTVTATTNGAGGNLITLAEGLSNFTWAGATLAGGVGRGNIVAFNQLYSTQGSVGGLCNRDGPSVMWSYFTGTGTAVTSIVLSRDGSKVAFVENVGTTATLRILKWKAGEGAGAGYPVAVDQNISGANWSTCTAGNSCVASIAFSGAAATDTRSSPFYDYKNDIIYAGDNSGRVHKFSGVFNGTPAEVTVTWPITVNAGAILTSPIYDSASGNIFVGDSTGRLSYVREVGSGVGACGAGSPPCLGTPNLAVGTAGAIVDAPVVDGSTGMVFAVNGADTTNFGTVLQASTALTGSVSFKIGSNLVGTAPIIYSAAFDNTYFNSAIPNIAGHMYVCGKDPGFNNRPAVYQLSFAATGVLTGVGAPLTGLVSADGAACSPVTEFYNPNGAGVGVARDWIFFSTGNNANTVDPIPFGSACRADIRGCVISIDVTGNPAWPPADVTNTVSVPLNNNGATSGIVVDNTSTSAQTSNFYFSLGANSTGAGPGVPSCNTTAGVGCAVKLTQLGLN